ncbi:MAG: ElyC/SanA/YdcF family protein [Patescibacteria group bacterium]|jgi:vancomycin permeability regulator SanA
MIHGLRIVFIALIGTALAGFLLLFSVIMIEGKRHDVKADLQAIAPQNVAIVFGAGIKRDNTPSDALEDRLIVAARLYHAGQVKTILVSGDNRFKNYSEPDVMRDALVERMGVDAKDIQADYAGRRTYDTCIRAKKLWGVDHAILISQDFHLPRAIWTCDKLGIESSGASASLRPYMFAVDYRAREILADLNAFINVYIWHPGYVGGEFVTDIDP